MIRVIRDYWPLWLAIGVSVGILAAMALVHEYAMTTVLSLSYTPSRTGVGQTIGYGRSGGGVTVYSESEKFSALVATSGGGPVVASVPRDRYLSLKEGARVCVDFAWKQVVPDDRCKR